MENSENKFDNDKQKSQISLKTNKNLKLKNQFTQAQKNIIDRRKDQNSRKEGTSKKKIKQQIQQQYEKQQSDLIDRLLIATLLDVGEVSQKLKSFILNAFDRKQKPLISIPLLYFLTKQYERLSNRAYTKNLIFYIIALFWDEGIANIGSSAQWTELAEKELENEQKQLSNSNLVQIDKWRQQLIEKYKRDILGIQKNELLAQKESKKQHTITLEFVLLIEQIQQQYYRQALSYKKFMARMNINQGKTSLNDRIVSIFQSMDQDQIGKVTVQKLISQYWIKGRNMREQQKCFLVNRIVNNLHIYDSHSHSIHNQTGNNSLADPTMARFQIENMMQMLNRVCGDEANIQSQSETFNSIEQILKLYHNFKNEIRVKIVSQDVSSLRKRNLNLRLVAQMQHIKQAATNIVQNGKIDTRNRLGYHFHQQALELDMRQYQTIKQHGQFIIDNQPTFRNEMNPKNINLRRDIQNQEISKTAEKCTIKEASLREQSDPFKKIELQNYGRSSNTRSERVPWKIQQSTKARNQLDKRLPWFEKTAEIKSFDPSAEEEANKSLYNTLLSEKQEYISLQQYNKLLRERVYHQIEIVRLEKLKNKLRCYDVLYSFD